MIGIQLKNPDGARLIRKFTIPRNPTKKDPRTKIRPIEDPIDGPLFVEYNRQDVRAEIDLSIHVPDLSPREQEIWVADQLINQRGIAVDAKAVDDCIAILYQAEAKYTAELRKITGGLVQEASEVAGIVAWLASQGYYTPNLDEDAVDALFAKISDQVTNGIVHEAEIKHVWRVLEIRQKLGSASVKKVFAFKLQSHRGRVYDLYVYATARTLRWGGTGPQPQNMPKGVFRSIEEVERALKCLATRVLECVEAEYGDALDCIANVLRSLLVSAPGYDLICSDYSAVEAVISACLTGEEWRIEVFRTHGKIYEATAARLYGIPFEELLRHKKETGAHHPIRDKTKRIELGTGFGGWVGAMKTPFIRLDEILDDDGIKKAVLDWRRANPSFPEMWGGQTRGRYEYAREELYGLEGAAIAAVKNPGQCFGYRGIRYQTQGDALYCCLLDGGMLTYHAPRLARSTREWAKPWELELTFEGYNTNPKMGAMGWVRMKTYGGKLFENVVQATGRNMQAAALVRLENAGYRPVIHSHDEIAGEVPEGWGSIEEFERIMSTPADDCYAAWPIKCAGGWRGKRYGKFE